MAETVRVLVEEEEVDKRIRDLGEQISKDYAGKQVHLVCVLKGGSFFLCELAKRITVPVSMDFMAVSSYAGTQSTCKVKIIKDLDEPVEGKDVLVVEDIVDTGLTMQRLLDTLGTRNPEAIHIASLLVKPEKLKVDLNIEYVAMEIPNDFIVGYGLDYDGFGAGTSIRYSTAQRFTDKKA